MNLYNLVVGCLMFVLLHVLVWFSSNAQFMKTKNFLTDNSLALCLILSPFIGILSYYASRYIYTGLQESVWAVRLIGFGLSYLIFPAFTWWFLGESMLTTKTMLCVFLSFLIILIQVYM